MPQPIDMQTELARMTAAQRIQEIADRASLVAQQRVTMDEQAQRVEAETQVQQTHPKGQEVDEETRRRNPYRGRRHRPPRAEELAAKTVEPPAAPEELHRFDVSV